jgi:uncharacterized protein YciI
MAKFVLELAFDKDTGKRLQRRPKHRDYLQSLLAQGKLVMAGPWKNDSGALLVFDAADAVSIVSLREWTPILPA